MASGMILLLDVGNSRIKAARSDGEKLVSMERYPVDDPNGTARAILENGTPDKLLFMSVNPDHSGPMVDRLASQCRSLREVGRDIPRGIDIRLDQFDRVGVDRTTAALAAYESYKSAVIVVVFGTAITFNCVSEDGAFLGGVICPGISMMARAMNRDTAFLPEITVTASEGFMAKTTEGSMLSGIYHGAVETTNGILSGLSKEMGKTAIVATGGDAGIVVPACPAITEVRPDLTLEGLLLLYQRYCG
jgi:type III pantothenate kinase